jgi:hypothetical protein
MPAKRTTAAVTVKVDASLKKLWTESNDRLVKATAEGASSWDQRYEAAIDIIEHEPPLYLAGGFSTEAAFFTAVMKEDRSTVYRNMRVARYATAKEIETFGASRLDAAITFIEARNGGPLKARTPIDFSTLRFPVDGGSKRLSDITVQEVRAAIAKVKGRARTSAKASPQATALNGLLAKAKISGVAVDVRRNEVVLRVPLASVAAVGKALAQYKAPPPAPK